MRKDARTSLILLASLMIVFPVYAADASVAPSNNLQGNPAQDVRPTRDYQQPEQDDDQEGQEITDEEQETIQGDQEQFDQERASLKPLDQDNVLRDRIAHDEAKLAKDMQAGNNAATQDDQLTLKVDKQELREQEAHSSDTSQELSEYREPSQNKVVAANTPGPDATATNPAASADNNRTPAEQEKENLQKYQSQPADAPARQPW